MPDTENTALALFRQFSPRFREIKWNPRGFRLREQSSRFYFEPSARSGYDGYKNPSIDIKEAGLTFTFNYDPASSSDPTSQMLYACWETIMAGPFAGRKFYAEPPDEMIEKTFEAFSGRRCSSGNIPIKLSYDGEKIQGLHLPEDLVTSYWNFFIPRDSAEGKAILAAIKLDQACYQKMERDRASREPSNTDALRAALGQALTAIPA